MSLVMIIIYQTELLLFWLSLRRTLLRSVLLIIKVWRVIYWFQSSFI